MKKLVAISLFVFLSFQSTAVVSAETTADFLNRVYKTSIAAGDRTALMEDLDYLERQFVDATIIEHVNFMIEKGNDAQKILYEANSEQYKIINKTLSEAVDLYIETLETVDLDLIVSARSQLITVMTEAEVSAPGLVRQSDAVMGGKLFTAPAISSDALGSDIVELVAKIKMVDTTLSYGEIPKAYPVKGEITSNYGVRKDPFTGLNAFHNGVDIAAPTGTNVSAWFNGKVTEAGNDSGWGNYVVIAEGDLKTLYAHLSEILVTEGEQVSQGSTIGKVGSTGRSTGPHLHLSLYIGKITVDPAKILQAR